MAAEPPPPPASPAINYATGDDILAHGQKAFHQDIATKVEMALGRAFPRMEVRFKHLSLSADLVQIHKHHHHQNGDAHEDDRSKAEDDLPTLSNHVKKKLAEVAAKKHTVRKHILKNVTGVFKPGTVTLILGQSGSGKSALMKLLSGRFPIDKEITIEGDIMYNGRSRKEILKRLPQFVAYVNQNDQHFPTLTVKETLDFAHECCGAQLTKRAEEFLTRGNDEDNAQALEAARSVIKHYPEIVVQALGLQDCQHTVVGDSMLRGISGGERKRLTTGEMAFGLKYVTLMDEISTGLDSAAAFDIIDTQRSIAKKLHKTVIISLLQPSPEVFALFDNVLLLNEGEVMYHGPRDQVQAYFEMLGFTCPPRRDLADFLSDLGTDQQLQYETGAPPLGMARHPRTASEFAELWVNSDLYQVMEADVNAPYDPELLTDATSHMDPLPAFHQSFWPSTWTLIKRQTILTRRNTTFLKGRALLVIIMGLLFSSIFYQVDMADVQVVMGVLFASILFLGLGQSSMLTTFYNGREVFYKQRAANFYRTASYVLAASVSQFPLAIAESVVFGSLVYWMCGFVDTAGTFLLFELLLMLSILVFLSLFFFLAAIAPDLHVAKPLAMVCLLIFILFAGFVVTKEQIPDYLIWLYWLDPVAWTLRSLLVSQYRNDKYDRCTVDDFDYCTNYGNLTMGKYSLALFDVPSEESWVVSGIIFMCGAYVLFMVLAYLVLEFHRYERPEHIALPKGEEATDRSGTSNSGEEVVQDGAYQLVSTPRNSSMGDEVIVRVNSEHERQVTPVTIAFQDLWYTVQVPAGNGQSAHSLDLLKGITGYALPGTITALMGSSGAGKTTLMDVIAGRKTGGKIQGKILLNGFEASDLAIRRSTGYCEQMDIHSSGSTFREALTFSAFLRQGADVPDSHKYDSVSECLELLALESVADQIVRGSTNEQMKRLTIGVELAAQPSVLFLDEPTSGLDARSAKVIMDGVRKVADSGRTVLCTIHQPSMEVFHLFDNLLLLKRGGETVFFGELGNEAHNLIQYFEAIPNVPKIANGYNPATWMLEVIGAGVNKQHHTDNTNDTQDQSSVDFVQQFNQSTLKQVLDSKLQEPGLFQPAQNLKPLNFAKKRAATDWVQFRFLLSRFNALYWRTPSYNFTRLVISLFLGLLFGIVYLDTEYTTYQGINGGLGMIFLATAFIGVVSFISVLPIAAEERAAFYRERASQTYNALWYFAASTLIEIPYVLVGALLFTVVFYPMVGLTGFGDGAFYWFNTALHVLSQAYFGQMLIFALPSIEVAAVIGVLFNGIFFMFMGFNPPAYEIPQGYKWLYAITPQRYSFAILAGLVFGDCPDDQLMQAKIAMMLGEPLNQPDWPIGCQLVQNAPVSVGNVPIKLYIEKVFGIKHAHIAQYLGIFLGMIVLLRIVAAFAMRYINHQKR